MADTVDLDAIEEFAEDAAAIDAKSRAIARLLAAARHAIVFTGAGISTSTGIPDFRGPDGVWTREAQGRAAPSSLDVADATPGVTHAAIASLVHRGVVKHVASQNVDGLHRRSGVPLQQLSELHGNCLLEECWRCGATFERDFDVTRLRNKACVECRSRVPFFCHCTHRKCPSCKVALKDTVVHFEEDLPHAALDASLRHGDAADVCLALGTSLLIYPAADVVRRIAKRRGTSLVIVNKQATPFDAKCAVRVFGDVDTVMTRVMEHLAAMEAPHHTTGTAPVTATAAACPATTAGPETVRDAVPPVPNTGPAAVSKAVAAAVRKRKRNSATPQLQDQ